MQAPAPFSEETIREISDRPWPGNVRELRNHVRRLCILGMIEPSAKDGCTERRKTKSEENPLPLKEYLERMEKDFIEGVLRQNGGQVASACTRLGISRKSLYDKVHRLAIDLNSFRKAD